MTPLIPAIGGALIIAGLLGLWSGLRKQPVKPAAPARLRLPEIRISKRTRLLFAAGLALGIIVALVSGWL